MKEWCTICGSFHELTTAGCPTMIKNVTASTNNIEVRYTRADLDKAVADEREKAMALSFDVLLFEKTRSEAVLKSAIQNAEAIRNRGKNHDNSN